MRLQKNKTKLRLAERGQRARSPLFRFFPCLSPLCFATKGRAFHKYKNRWHFDEGSIITGSITLSENDEYEGGKFMFSNKYTQLEIDDYRNSDDYLS